MSIKYSSNIDKVYQLLLISLAFIFPLTVVGGNILMGIIVLLWIFSGDYKSKFFLIRNNALAVASILFFLAHLIGLLWTSDFIWGLHILKKMQDFLIFLPILLTITKKSNIKYYISSFLLAITISEVLSYLVWFEIIPPFKNATVENPTPFMSHISYNPFLAFAFYLVSHEALFNKSLKVFYRYMYGLFSITMSINMFITGGRAGQVVFFVLLMLLIFQVYGRSIKFLFTTLFLFLFVFLTAYNFSPLFNERFNRIGNEIYNYESNKGTSVGLRLTFAIHSWEIIKNNPVFGVGTGDFPNAYKKINMSETPHLANAKNPHNMYTLVTSQLGIFGLLSMLYLLYVQIKLSRLNKSKFLGDVGLVLPILFLVIMWSDSYLLGHYTTFLFVFFSSFLYKDFEKT